MEEGWTPEGSSVSSDKALDALPVTRGGSMVKVTLREEVPDALMSSGSTVVSVCKLTFMVTRPLRRGSRLAATRVRGALSCRVGCRNTRACDPPRFRFRICSGQVHFYDRE